MVGLGERRIKTRRPEEVDEGRCDERLTGWGNTTGVYEQRVRSWHACRHCCLPVLHEQSTVGGVGIDRAVVVTSAVKVVGEVQGKARAEIALETQIDLLRVGIDEILGLGISERLES